MFARSVLPVCLLSILATAAACDDDDLTVVDVAVADGNFTVLVDALVATGLDRSLADDDEEFTVFAPPDSAFARLPDGVVESLDIVTLAEILGFHVVSGRVLASDVVARDSLTTIEGSDVSVRVIDGTVVLDGTSQITSTDILADNGVIHVIDSVMLPPVVPFPGDLVEALQAYPLFTTLVEAVTAAGLAGALQDGNGGAGLTVFAPTDFAFEELGIDLATLSQEELTEILLFHVVGEALVAESLIGLDSVTTLQGDALAIDVLEGEVVLNGGTTVIEPDLRTTNGVIHVIDSVLIPPE